MRRFRNIILTMLTVVTLCFGQATQILRPTSDVDPVFAFGLGCGGTNAGSKPMPLSRDAAGIATQSTQAVTSNVSPPGNIKYKTRSFGTWPAPLGTFSTLTLYMNASAPGSDPTPGGAACIGYSTDAGATWTQVQCDLTTFGWPQQTFAVPLSPTQNLNNLKAGVCVMGINGGAESVLLYDVWLLGTYASQPGGTGSGAGTASRRGFILF